MDLPRTGAHIYSRWYFGHHWLKLDSAVIYGSRIRNGHLDANGITLVLFLSIELIHGPQFSLLYTQNNLLWSIYFHLYLSLHLFSRSNNLDAVIKQIDPKEVRNLKVNFSFTDLHVKMLPNMMRVLSKFFQRLPVLCAEQALAIHSFLHFLASCASLWNPSLFHRSFPQSRTLLCIFEQSTVKVGTLSLLSASQWNLLSRQLHFASQAAGLTDLSSGVSWGAEFSVKKQWLFRNL